MNKEGERPYGLYIFDFELWSESRTNDNINFRLGTQTGKTRKNMNTIYGLISASL